MSYRFLTILILMPCLIQLEDLKRLCKLGSRTPGHPENYSADSIEVTTGMKRSLNIESVLCIDTVDKLYGINVNMLIYSWKFILIFFISDP